MLGSLRNFVLIVLICAMVFSVGCASSLMPLADTGASITDSGGAAGGLQQTSDGAKLAAYAFVGFVIALTFTIDLLILVGTHRDPFPCSRAVISVCH